MNELKACRLRKKLTQKEAANRIGISLRSYITYEKDGLKESTPKYRFLLQELEKENLVDETHGILSLEMIKETCTEVFNGYPVEFCYLFGSYAKGKASEESDVDLLVSTEISGLRYYEIVECLREKLHKKVDLLNLKQLLDNEELLREVMKDGIRIFRTPQKSER